MRTKLYTALTIAGAALTFTASAQNIDVAAFSTIEPDAKFCVTSHLSPTTAPTGDSVHGIFGLQFNGPEVVFEGDKVTMRHSFHKFLTQEEATTQGVPFEDRYSWYSIYQLTAEQAANGGFAFSRDSIGDIGLLLDYDVWEEYNTDSIVMYGPPHENFENGRRYGFFVRTWGMGEDANSIVNVDSNPGNNWSVTPIIWNDCATSIKDMIVPKAKEELAIYPNPATAEVSFKYNFEKNTNMKVYVRDLTGRAVKVKDFGHITAGEREFTVDVSALSNGVYTLEMSTGTISAVSKLTISK